MSDTMTFHCPKCGQDYEGFSADLGAEFECERCGTSFRLDPDAAKPSFGRKRPSGFVCWLGMLKRYFGFRGRTRRREFWWAFFFQTIFLIAAAFADEVTESEGVVFAACSLAAACPMLAALSRRLHDTDKSAWWVLLSVVPVLNLAYLAWLLTNGDRGRNRFGPDPKES